MMTGQNLDVLFLGPVPPVVLDSVRLFVETGGRDVNHPCRGPTTGDNWDQHALGFIGATEAWNEYCQRGASCLSMVMLCRATFQRHRLLGGPSPIHLRALQRQIAKDVFFGSIVNFDLRFPGARCKHRCAIRCQHRDQRLCWLGHSRCAWPCSMNADHTGDCLCGRVHDPISDLREGWSEAEPDSPMLPTEAGLRDYFPRTDFLDRTTWESGNFVRVALRRSSPQISPFQRRSEARAAWLLADR